MAMVVNLPVYEDYTQFAIWPAEQSVSKIYSLLIPCHCTEISTKGLFNLNLLYFRLQAAMD